MNKPTGEALPLRGLCPSPEPGPRGALWKRAAGAVPRAGFFSHLLKLLFLAADRVVLLVMPALPEMLGSGVLQL